MVSSESSLLFASVNVTYPRFTDFLVLSSDAAISLSIMLSSLSSSFPYVNAIYVYALTMSLSSVRWYTPLKFTLSMLPTAYVVVC